MIKMFRRLPLSLIIALVLISQLALVNISAHSLETLYNTDNITGWIYNGYHMGQKNYTYRFTNTIAKEKYLGYMNSAAAIWGSAINFTYSSSGKVAISHSYTTTLGRLATTNVTYNPSTDLRV